MYWILFVMAAIAAVVIALVVGGLATPRAHAVARTTCVPAAPDAVWVSMRDLAQHGAWSFASGFPMHIRSPIAAIGLR